MDLLISDFRRDAGSDVSRDKMVLQRLEDAAEQAKIDLSMEHQPSVEVHVLQGERAEARSNRTLSPRRHPRQRARTA